jgi:sugar O-acyltransferase (sialic acid O-acetyltransferase NeuD family)
MIKITIPKLGASDNSATVVDLLVPNGSFVEKDTIFAEIETSKSVHEIESETEGYLYYNLEVGREVNVGELVAIISESEINNHEKLFESKKNQQEKRTSRKAALLIDKYELDISEFDVDFIREKDVLEKITSPIEQLTLKEEDVIILGCGGHASMCLDIAIKMNLNVLGYLDDNKKDSFRGLPWLGLIDSIFKISNRELKPKLILGIGFLSNLKKRDQIYLKARQYFEFVNLIHPKSIVESSASIDNNSGMQIMAGAIIGTEVTLGPNTIVNSGAIISHHSKIGRTCHITPGACLAGNVEVGDRATIGMNSTIFLGVKIPSDTIVQNLSRVDEDL